MAQKIRTQDVMELFAEKLDKAIEKENNYNCRWEIGRD